MPRRSRFRRPGRERSSRRTADPVGAAKLAGLGAALLLFVAVGAGFRGEAFSIRMAAWLGRFSGLAEPVLFGASWLEIGGLLAAALVLAAALLRLR